MKYVGILCLLALVGCEFGAVDDPITGRVFERQSALTAISPPQPFSPTYYVPGFTTVNAPGGTSPTRPELGSPTWPSTVASWMGQVYYQNPPTCCLGEYPHFAIPDNRKGAGEVMLWFRDRRWPRGGFQDTSYYANAWADDVPLRGGPNSGASGPVFTISDFHAATGPQEPEQTAASPFYQLTYMIADWQANILICSQANFTGVCHEIGYYCSGAFPTGVCHHDTAQELANPHAYTDLDLSAYTADTNGVPYQHLSLQIEYPF